MMIDAAVCDVLLAVRSLVRSTLADDGMGQSWQDNVKAVLRTYHALPVDVRTGIDDLAELASENAPPERSP